MGAELIPRNAISTDDPRWVRFPACPSCGEPGDDIGRLRIDRYGGLPRSEPQPVIRLRRCVRCGLVYKDIVPSPSYLTHLTMITEEKLWQDAYAYRAELALLDAIIGNTSYDLLDVGAAGGVLLRAMDHRRGRHSALDIFKFDRLHLGTGEFIQGFLDDEKLDWSGAPYDVVTAFDVLEHLYAPTIALRNLRSFCKSNGWALIETGDSDWTSSSGLAKWYYLGNYQHHMAWNKQSLAYAASASGFEIVSVTRKRHKLGPSKVKSARHAIKRLLYLAAPERYLSLARACGFEGQLPAGFSDHDHMRVLLRATDASVQR